MGRWIKWWMCGLLDKLTRRLRHGSIGQKDEQAYIWTKKQTDALIEGQTDKLTWTQIQTDGQTDGGTDRQTDRWTQRLTDGQTNWQMYTQTDRQMNGQTDGGTEKWMDRWTSRQIVIQVNLKNCFLALFPLDKNYILFQQVLVRKLSCRNWSTLGYDASQLLFKIHTIKLHYFKNASF